MLLIVLLWFGISAPLSAIGSYIGSREGVRTQFLLLCSVGLQAERSPSHTPSGLIRSLGKYPQRLATFSLGYVPQHLSSEPV